jgi:ATP-dependent exoDNAse (exonuclease V) alpha subunit/DNA polymerase III epsilon subunit-like protein
MGDARRSLEAAGIDENDFLDYAEKSGASDLRQPDLDKLIEKYKADKGSTTTTATTTEESDKPTDEQRKTIDDLIAQIGDETNFTSKIVTAMLDSLTKESADMAIDMLKAAIANTTAPTTTTAPAQSVFTPGQIDSVNRRINLLTPEQQAKVKEAMESATPKTAKDIMSKIINTLDNAEIISRIRKGMPVDDILARRKTDTVGANLLFDLDRSPKEIAQRLATYKPTVNLDGTPIADAQQTTTTVSGDDTKSVSSLISDVIDSLAKDLQTKFGALKYRYSSKTPQNAEQAEKDHEIYLEYLSTVVPAVMQALKERLDSQTAAGNPDAQKNYDDAVSKLKQELWGQNRGAVYTSEAEKLVGSDRTKEMSDEANKALNDLLAGVKKPEKQVTTETTTKDTFGKIGTSGNLTGNVDYSIDKFGQIALTNAPEDFDARMAESRGLIIVTDNGKKSIVLTKNNDENRAAALNLIKERLEGPAPVTTKVETQTEVAQDVVTGQERPEGGVSKKISELNVGDRLYDEETESMATVVGVYEDPDRAGRIVLTIRFDDGREDSASYKKSYVVEAYPSPEAPAATTTTAEDVVGGEDADTSKTEAEVVEDSQVIVEQGESTTAEPGSTVLEEPDAEAVEPVEPKRKPRGPRKPRKVNLSDVSDEEREAFIRIFDALENFNRVEEEYGGKKYDSKWYIDEKDRKFDNKDVEELASQNTKGIGEDLGIQLMDSTTDAYEPGAFSSTRQPTPGAFTGRVARMVEGKTKAETRNILKGLKVSWFDTETTGISNFDGDPTNNDVVQVGIVNTQNGEVLERLNIYINPGVEDGVRLGKWATNNLVKDAVGEDGQPILGPDGKPTTEPITNEWLSEQMSIADAVQQIMDFMGRDPILGGQNVPFDLQVLQRMLDKAGVRGYRIGGTIDSKDLSEEFLPKYNEYEGTDGPKRFDKERNKFVPTSSLGYVAEFLGFGTTRWHSADADAEDAWKLASATMDRAASEDPTGTSDLMNQSAMRSRYTERMAKFLKTIDPRNPSTAKQHGAVRKEGFGEYLDDLGLSRDHQNALFDQIKQMTRGEAARFISTFIEANPLPKPSAKPSIQNRVLDLNQVTKNIKNLERLKSQPLPSALRDMGTVPTDTEEKIQHFNREFSDFLKKKYPDLTLGEIWSSRNSNIDVEKDFNYFSDLYQKTMSLPDSKVFGIGNATITAKDGILSKRDLAIVSNALEVLQERFSLGETPIDVRYMPQEELDRLAEKKNVTGSAYIDEDGAHIIISERTLGVYEKDGRSGKTGSVSAHLATVIHEYGHLVHALLLGSNFTEKEKADLAKEFQRRFKKTRVTDYGETSTAEKFAELFYDMEYSRIEGTEPAVPEFSEFMESIKGRKAAIKPSLLNRMGIKKPQARQMPPENTKPEFDGATKLSGANLAAFEGSSDSLRGSDQEAGYIPDPSDQKAFNEFRLQISLNPGDLVSEAQARIRFKKEIEKAKKDARRYEVLKVEGTNSYIRYKNGDASPEAIQQTIDQLRDLEDFNVAGGISQVVTLAKRETFSVGRLFATTQGTEEEIHGYSLLDSDKGIGHIVVDPDLVSESPGSVPGIAVGQYYANGGVDAQNMLKRTLVHEYAHNWAKVILGHRQQDSARFDEFVRSVVQRIQTSGGRSVHPISEIAEGGDGESFAEFFTAAFFQIVEGRMLPTKGSPLDQFIQFFAKYAGANVEPIIKNISPIVQVEESSSGGQRLKFPKNHEGAGSENVYLEYNRRREFYRNGLDPYGRPLSDARAAMIREYSSYIDKLESAYQSTMRAEDFDVMTSAMAALKRVYDSMFFAYAKNNSRFNVDTIGENIEANEQSFRSWTAPTSPLFLPESEGPFKNEITTGRYTDVDGISYPLVYISSTKADGRTYTATVALDPENTDFDLATANMDTLIEASVGKMITISDKEKTSQILDYISVDGDLRHRGIATSLLSFTRSNTTKKVLHKGKSAPDVSAWAQSVDSSEKSYESAPRAFDDASHVARHNRNAINLISDREPPQEIDTSSETLEAEALHYAGENYGNFYHPNLQDYMSKQGGGLGVYNSTVGYVSAETLSSMRGNEPKDPDSVARKVEDLQDGDGFDQPVSVVYNPRTGEAYVADGNHRVQASLDAGVAYVPTRVFIMDVPPAQENPQIKKLERDGGLPLPEGADEVHPYFVFNKEDLVNGKDLSDPSVVEEMASNVVVWSGRGKASERNRSGRYDPDPNNIFEQLAPGEYVMDKKTKKIYQVYSQDFTTEVGQDGVERAVFTGKIVVREFEGNLDNLSRVRISTQFGDNNIRYAQGGQSSADDSYNDARSYIDEIRDPADFENVTDSFIKLSDQPILISDTMYVVQTETGIKGRISKFVSPGVVRLDVLKGYNEDGEPLYDQIESPITQLLPIQNQQQVPNGQPAMEHAPDMQISNSTWDSINTLSSTLLKWGYLSEDKYKAIQTLVHGKFITQSGALDLERSLRNHDVVRRAKIRGVAVKSPATGEPVAQAPVQQAAPSAPAAPSVGQGEAGGRSFEQLLEMKRARKKADAGLSVEEFASPVTKIKVTKNPPTQSQILEVERLLSEDGAVTPQRAFDILSSLPTLNAEATEAVLEEIRADVLNKRISKDESITGLVVPKGFNRSKISGYQPAVEESSTGFEIDRDAEEPNEDGEVSPGAKPEEEGPKMSFNAQQKSAIDSVVSSEGGLFFITGGAGTGKTTIKKEIDKREKAKNRRTMTIAPTGKAALQAEGATIHSTFKIPVGPLTDFSPSETYNKNMGTAKGRKSMAALRTADTIFIDEVSMVRADLMDAMDRMLRVVKGNMSEPFGGAKIVMLGDLAQLPPVGIDSSPENQGPRQRFQETYADDYFLSANSWASSAFEVHNLTESMRQSAEDDAWFEQFLRERARFAEVTQEDMEKLWEISEKNRKRDAEEGVTSEPIHLVSTNAAADEINKKKFAELEGEAVKFTATIDAPEGSDIKPFVRNGGLPKEEMEYKIGEPVMFIKNDDAQQRKSAGGNLPNESRWVNGSQGVITRFEYAEGEDGQTPIAIYVKIGDKEHRVVPATWEDVEYGVSTKIEEEKNIVEGPTQEVLSTYTQIPLMPGWAMTTHKSQGATMDSAVVDYSIKYSDNGDILTQNSPFAAGQVYVALSRLRSSNGLYLTRKLNKNDFIRIERSVTDFFKNVDAQTAANQVSESSAPKKFDPLKGYISEVDLASALDSGELTGPAGQNLTDYQSTAIKNKLRLMRENPNSADRYREEIAKLMNSWFGVEEPGEEIPAVAAPIEIRMDNFRDPSERQATIDLLTKSGIPYTLKYD